MGAGDLWWLLCILAPLIYSKLTTFRILDYLYCLSIKGTIQALSKRYPERAVVNGRCIRKQTPFAVQRHTKVTLHLSNIITNFDIHFTLVRACESNKYLASESCILRLGYHCGKLYMDSISYDTVRHCSRNLPHISMSPSRNRAESMFPLPSETSGYLILISSTRGCCATITFNYIHFWMIFPLPKNNTATTNYRQEI